MCTFVKKLRQKLGDGLEPEGNTGMTKSSAQRCEKLSPIHPGEILGEEFLIPMKISQYRLARAIGVDARRAKLNSTTISRRTVERLEADRDTVYWDSELLGFGVRVYPTGRKVYVVQTRADGKDGKRVTVGRHGVITAEEARRRAAHIIARIKAGEDPTHDGRAFRTLNVLDEFTRESLAIRVRRKLSSTDVIDVLTDLFILRGIPAYVRSDNGPEFVAEAVRRWITAVGARTAFIEPGSPWENGYIESFNARLRDELLNGEIFYTLKEAQVLIEAWRRHYNAVRPHGSLGYRPPAPETIIWPSWPPGSAPLRRPPSLAEKPPMH